MNNAIAQKSEKRKINTISRALKKTFLRSSTIIIIKKAIILRIVSSQKTSCNLGNFYISDYKFED